VGGAFVFGPGDPGSVPCLCITFSLIRFELNKGGLPMVYQLYGGKPQTILKASYWLSETK